MRAVILICAGICGAAMPTAAAEVASAAAVNRVGDALYGRLAAAPGNLVLAPVGVTAVLAMAAAGARGVTAQEMATVTGIHAGDHATFANWWRRSVVGSPELRVATKLWVARDLALDSTYVALCQEAFGGDVGQVEFAEPATARAAINAWAGARTGGLAPELLAAGVLARETRLVLTDVVHFRAPWAHPFEPRLTADSPFRPAGGGAITTPTMHQTGDFAYAETASVQAVRLPYAGGRQVCELYLPRAASDLATVEALLTCGRLHAWADRWRPQMVRVVLPRFAVTTAVDFRPALAAIGMPAAFTPAADFSGIATTERLAIARVCHGAAIRVDEAGTEAAASTGVLVAPSCVAPDRSVIDFVADHPFLFLIRDTDSGAVLFLGRVCDPRG